MTDIRREAIERMVAWLLTWDNADRREIAQAIMPPRSHKIARRGNMRPPNTIPLGKRLTIRSVSGLVCEAVATKPRYLRGPDQWGPRRVHCRSNKGGDIWAVGWMENVARAR